MSDRPGGAMQVWLVIKWTGVYTLHNNGAWIKVQRHPEGSVML